MPSLTFIHLSDLHILPHPNTRYFGQDTAQMWRDAVAKISQLELHPDAFIISGDLVHNNHAQSYRHLQTLLKLLTPFKVPVLLGLGNHDNRLAFRKIINQQGGPIDPTPYYYSTWVKECQILMLDTSVPGSHFGQLDYDQLVWLRHQLDRPAPGGRLLVCHHPPVQNAVPWFDDYVLRNASALGQVIARQNVSGVLSGHVHFSSFSTFRGIPCITAPGLGYSFDACAQAGLRYLDGSGFNIIHLRQNKLLTTPVMVHSPHTQLHYYNPRSLASDRILDETPHNPTL